MSYFQGRRGQRGLSGVQSQPQGGRVSNKALGAAVTEYNLLGSSMPRPTPPPPPPSQIMAGRGRVGPRWYRQLQGTTLGADDAPGNTLSTPTLSEPEATTRFRSDLLTSNRALLEAERERTRKEELRGYLQIGATLMIPVAAAIWKALGIGKKRKISPP
jgi:hypothetical protein